MQPQSDVKRKTYVSPTELRGSIQPQIVKDEEIDPGILAGANAGIQDMLYSTITKKVANTALTRSVLNPKTADMFRSVVSSSEALKLSTEEERKKYLIDPTQPTLTMLHIQKKGKKMGGIKYREGTLTNKNFFTLTQNKGKGHRDYQLPLVFLPQTREEYQATRRGLPWPPDRLKNGPTVARILYKRKVTVPQGSIAKKEKESKDEFDTAFIFHDENEFLRVRNYLFCLKSLDVNLPSQEKHILELIQGLSRSFRLQLISSVSQ